MPTESQSSHQLEKSENESKEEGHSNSVSSGVADEDQNVPTLMLERFASGGSRALKKTLSQVSSILPSDRASSVGPKLNVPTVRIIEDPNGHPAADAESSALPKRAAVRPRLLSPVPSTDAIPIYRGSYAQSMIGSPPTSRPVSLYHHSRTETPTGSQTPKGHSRAGSLAVATPDAGRAFASMSQDHLEQILCNEVETRNTFGIHELRDGFFDAVFVPRSIIEKLAYQSLKAATLNMNDEKPLAFMESVKEEARKALHLLMARNYGCPYFFKSFLAYGIAYVLCLVNATGNWLGEYRYLMCLATVIHHAGRTAGNQIEIAIMTLSMGAFGMALGTLAVFISSSTTPAENGYGGVLAAFLLVIVSTISWFRASFIRLYHGMISFSAVFLFTVLLDAETDDHSWKYLWNIGIPYTFGILTALLVNLVILPDFGHHSIMTAFTDVIAECSVYLRGVVESDDSDQFDRLEALNLISYDLSIAYREMCNEVTISTLSTKQAMQLRNAIQICIGRLRIIPSAASLTTGIKHATQPALIELRVGLKSPVTKVIREMAESFELCGKYIAFLNSPTAELLDIAFKDEIKAKRKNLLTFQAEIIKTYRTFLYSDMLNDTEWQSQPVVDLLLFIHYLTESCHSLLDVLKEFETLAIHRRSWKFSFPQYPLSRFLKTNNRQTTHDRGGQSAFFFFHTMNDVKKAFHQLPVVNRDASADDKSDRLKKESGILNGASLNSIGHTIWLVLHRLQQHETRFALRISITILLLSLPAFIQSSRQWYSTYDVWMAPFCALVMLHPRVGGSFHDLLVRTGAALLGIIWAAIGFRAGNGNPYVLAVFAAIFSKSGLPACCFVTSN